MSTKHTPGPWVVEDPMSDQLWIVQANLPTYEWTPIAIVTDDSSEIDAMDRGTRPISKAERDANANLIAAAPDLLAALKRIDATWDGEPEDMADARMSIAKAEGRS